MDDVASQGAVVVFTCNHCPSRCVRGASAKFAKDYKEKGVETIAINVNNLEEDKLPAMKKRGRRRSGPSRTSTILPGDRAGVRREVTPHWYVLDSRGTWRTSGIRRQPGRRQATKRYVVDRSTRSSRGRSPPRRRRRPSAAGSST